MSQCNVTASKLRPALMMIPHLLSCLFSLDTDHWLVSLLFTWYRDLDCLRSLCGPGHYPDAVFLLTEQCNVVYSSDWRLSQLLLSRPLSLTAPHPNIQLTQPAWPGLDSAWHQTGGRRCLHSHFCWIHKNYKTSIDLQYWLNCKALVLYIHFTELKLWWDTQHSCFYYLTGRDFNSSRG